MPRRSKRKSTVLESLTMGHGGLRRSKRKMAMRENESQIYGNDYGILPCEFTCALSCEKCFRVFVYCDGRSLF